MAMQLCLKLLIEFFKQFIQFSYLCRLMLSEQKVQSKRIKELEAEGYYVIKLIKTNKNGIPDLIAIHPEKGVLFSEVKRANGKLSPLQKYRIEELKKLGINVEVHYGDG